MKLLGAEITPRRVVARVGGHPISYGAPEDGLAAFRREFPEVFGVGAGDIRFVRCEHLPHWGLDHPRWDITFTGVTEGWPGVLVPSGNSRGRDGVWEVTGVQPPPPPPSGTVGGWWVRADLSVRRTRANAQSATTWCGTELVYDAVQQAKH